MSDLEKVDVLDQLSVAVVVIDQKLRIRYLNTAAEAMLGTSESRGAGIAVRELLTTGTAQMLADFSNVFASGQSITRRAEQFRVRDGSTLIADLTVSRDQSGTHLIIELQPLNRLIRINRDDHSLFSQETTRKLVRGLAHEVKNPLGGLRGAAQLLERELHDEQLKEYTRIIIEEADRLTRLVDDMLGPNRQPQKRSVNVHSVLEHVVRLIDAEAPDTIRFRRDYDPSLPDIQVDEAQMIQAMLNIVRNAAQALERVPDPTITLRTRIMRQFTIGPHLHRIVVQIDIIDNGPGIPPDMLDRIYFPMISGRPDGTGLGLAITQNIIGQHGGVIECESEPGRTCFSVFLPLDERAIEDRG
ncbi:MAG: nitrogen regulation protein NR(II) [Pseudomonadales bacterium]